MTVVMVTGLAFAVAGAIILVFASRLEGRAQRRHSTVPMKPGEAVRIFRIRAVGLMLSGLILFVVGYVRQ